MSEYNAAIHTEQGGAKRIYETGTELELQSGSAIDQQSGSTATWAGTNAFSGTTSFSTMPTIKAATVAATGTNQATAAAVATGFSVVTAADGTKAIVFPAAAAGKAIALYNAANAVLNVFPGTDDKINGGSANAAVTMAAYSSCWAISFDGTDWYTIPKTPS